MPASRNEIVVLAKPRPPGSEPAAMAAATANFRGTRDALRSAGVELRALFTPSASNFERLALARSTTAETMALEIEKSRYFTGVLEDGDPTDLVARIRALPEVETAYWKPGVQNPIAPDDGQAAEPSSVDALVRPPDFRSLQGYLAASPGGIAAEAAWARPGGRGTGVRIIDIEGAWQFTHADLQANSGGLLAGTQYPEPLWRNHGTAVLGEIGGDADAYGVHGICPDALLSGVSHGGLGSAKAISIAADKLRAGDILLLEMHRPGPRHDYSDRGDQKGFIAIEWWPDDFLAIRAAVTKGIIVVEAAGNGGEDFDDALYETPGPHFPASWRNPLRTGLDSGAILVGAGAPPSGHGEDRSRLGFSNFGRRVDCQGWGRGVVTAGYGEYYRDAQFPSDEDFWYTRTFSGTSSASPMVAGAIACLQGIAMARSRLLSPAAIRDALRRCGSPQTGAPQNIGRRPDLASLIEELSL